MTALEQLHRSIYNPSMYVVDIGASWGIKTDPVYTFIIDPRFKGLCIEGNRSKVISLREKTHFDIHDEYVYPHTIVDAFQQHTVPLVFDILKIDIDGYDLDILRRILAVYKPRIIIAEINEKIPPPLRFEVLYRENYVWEEDHCYGFSISAGEKVLDEHGYSIIEIFELQNIICIDSSISVDDRRCIQQIYKEDYIDKSGREEELWWNKGVNYWLELDTIDELMFDIIRYFRVTDANIRRDRIKAKQINIDYSLEY